MLPTDYYVQQRKNKSFSSLFETWNFDNLLAKDCKEQKYSASFISIA